MWLISSINCLKFVLPPFPRISHAYTIARVSHFCMNKVLHIGEIIPVYIVWSVVDILLGPSLMS